MHHMSTPRPRTSCTSQWTRETAELRFGVGDMHLPEGRKRGTSSREDEEEDAQMCPCGNAVE